jgi:prepilin-type N-terminal cleavage/methylation domain-containing protein
MTLYLEQKARRNPTTGFTLIELLVALMIFILVAGGVIYGYVQSNRTAEWSAISLAAQSCATEGAEQARAADWDPRGNYPVTNGFGTKDELAVSTVTGFTNLAPQTNILDIPIKGVPSASDFPFFVKTFITISNISANPPLRQIRSDAVWTFYLTGRVYTNTCIFLRAPDQ